MRVSRSIEVGVVKNDNMPTLRSVLNNPKAVPGGWLFLQKDGARWQLDEECFVMDLKEITPEEDVDDDADMPDEARRLGLRCVLSISRMTHSCFSRGID